MRQIMLECSVRAALIAIGTAAALGVLRVKSAGARHAAWTGVVALMLLLPVWMAWGPRASLPVLPAQPMPVGAVMPMAFTIPNAPAAAPAPLPVAPRAPWNWLAMNWLAIAYCAGSSLLLTRLALGTIRARLLTSVAAPVTIGLLRPRVILPDHWRDWPREQLDAVLTHEGEHVRRRDPLVKWLALFNRAIFWFHPLAWWLERHLSALAEEACDAAVLERGHDPHAYTGYLLEMARSVGKSGVRVKAVAMAMPGSSLPQRVRQILLSGPAPRLSRVRAVCLAAACAMVSVVFAGASIDRESFIPELPLPLAAPAAPLPVATDIPVQAPVAPVAPIPELAQEARYGDHRLLVFYFEIDQDPAELLVEKVAASRFLADRGPSSDLIAIITSGRSGVKVVEDFTADRDQLETDVRRINSDPNPSTDATPSLAGMLIATRMLGVLPQKKAMIYFSKGSVEKANPEERQSVINAAVRANVAFYPIDSPSLVNAIPPPTIGRGDTIALFGLGTDVVTGSYTVRADGVLALPLLGDIKAEGLTPSQLQATINQAATSLGDPRITINLAGLRPAGK